MNQQTKDQIVTVFEHMVAEKRAENAGDEETATAESQAALAILLDVLDFDSAEVLVEDGEVLLALGMLLAVAEHYAAKDPA